MNINKSSSMEIMEDICALSCNDQFCRSAKCINKYYPPYDKGIFDYGNHGDWVDNKFVATDEFIELCNQEVDAEIVPNLFLNSDGEIMENICVSSCNNQFCRSTKILEEEMLEMEIIDVGNIK